MKTVGVKITQTRHHLTILNRKKCLTLRHQKKKKKICEMDTKQKVHIFNVWTIITQSLNIKECIPLELQIRAATFTRVNGTVSCFCNKHLGNWPTVYTNFVTWQASWFINSISQWKKYSLKQWYITSRSRSSIRLFVFSDSAVFCN